MGLKGLHCDKQYLADEKGSDTVDIDLVGATADNEVAGDAKENENIDAGYSRKTSGAHVAIERRGIIPN